MEFIKCTLMFKDLWYFPVFSDIQNLFAWPNPTSCLNRGSYANPGKTQYFFVCQTSLALLWIINFESVYPLDFFRVGGLRILPLNPSDSGYKQKDGARASTGLCWITSHTFSSSESETLWFVATVSSRWEKTRERMMHSTSDLFPVT